MQSIIDQKLEDGGYIKKADLSEHELNCRKLNEDKFATKDATNELKLDFKELKLEVQKINENIGYLKVEVGKTAMSVDQMAKTIDTFVVNFVKNQRGDSDG